MLSSSCSTLSFVLNRAGCLPEIAAWWSPGSGAYCLVLKLSQSQSDGLIKLRDAITAERATISASELRGFFGLSEDPCNRLDTVIKGGTIKNSGDACDLTADPTELPRQLTGLRVTVQVPGVVLGTMKKDAGMTLVDFPYSQMRGKLELSNTLLDADWGGDIKSIYVDNNSVGFSVGDSACYRVVLQ